MAIVHQYDSDIKSGKYSLHVNVVEDYWEGTNSADMEGMPGTWLRSKVTLTGISGDKCSPLEILVQPFIPFVILESHPEITSQPEGYSELCYKALVKKMQNSQELVENAIRQKVKEKL